MNNPPPLTPEASTAPPRSALPLMLAWTGCLLALISVVALAILISTNPQSLRLSGSSGSAGWVALLMLSGVGGLLLSLVALVMMGRPRRLLVLAPSLAGCVLGAGILAAGGYAVFQGIQEKVQTRRSLADVNRSVRELQQEVKDSLGSTNETDVRLKGLEKFRSTINQASKSADPETARVLEASSAVLGRLQVLARTYEAQTRQLQGAEVLNTADLKDKAQIAGRRKVVTDFMEANRKLQNFFVNMESSFREEMKQQGIPQRRIDREIVGFSKSTKQRYALIQKIRQKDEQMGQDMLTMLDLFEKQWGAWRYNPSSDQVTFDSDETVKQYNELLAEIERLGKEQMALQKLAQEVP